MKHAQSVLIHQITVKNVQKGIILLEISAINAKLDLIQTALMVVVNRAKKKPSMIIMCVNLVKFFVMKILIMKVQIIRCLIKVCQNPAGIINA